MTMHNADLALAAARTRILGEQLDDAERDKLIEEWSRLLDELDNPRASRELTLADYRAEIERRLTAEREARAPVRT